MPLTRVEVHLIEVIRSVKPLFKNWALAVHSAILSWLPFRSMDKKIVLRFSVPLTTERARAASRKR